MKKSTKDILLQIAYAVLLIALKFVECYQSKNCDNWFYYANEAKGSEIYNEYFHENNEVKFHGKRSMM